MQSYTLNSQIDKLIANQYNNSPYDELKAVSMLFSKVFLTGLKNILNSNSSFRPNITSKYNIRVGWIDKIPLAEFNPSILGINGMPINERVEIGDFLIVLSQSHLQHNDNKTVNYEEQQRALIIQAKMSGHATPNSPIGHIPKGSVTPTVKELALLSEWPSFDLYLASRSKIHILPDLSIPFDLQQSCFSGFNNKIWYCGPAINGAPCNLTLGEIIENITKNKAGYTFHEANPKNDWDELIKAMVDICQKSDRPKRYINAVEPGRLLSSFIQFVENTECEGLVFEDNNTVFPILFIDRYLIEGQ